MTSTEVIAILVSCRPLAAKLTAFGIYIQLDNEEHLALQNFFKVLEAGWVGDFRAHRLAGLNREDIMALSGKMKLEWSSDS